MIPEGSTLRRMKNGDILITWPGKVVPLLCVQKDQTVRRAIIREPVDEKLAAAARDYVARHLSS